MKILTLVLVVMLSGCGKGLSAQWTGSNGSSADFSNLSGGKATLNLSSSTACQCQAQQEGNDSSGLIIFLNCTGSSSCPSSVIFTYALPNQGGLILCNGSSCGSYH